MSTPTRASDEVSLVDLAVMLVRRWKLLLIVFLTLSLIAMAYALLKPTRYTYTSLYRIADSLQTDREEAPGLETPTAVIAQLESIVLPQSTREFLKNEELERLPFQVKVSQPVVAADTHPDDEALRLVFMSSVATQAQAGQVEALHRQTLENLQALQSSRVERLRRSLQARLSAAENAMNQAQGDAALHLAREIVFLEPRLAALEDARIEQVAVRASSAEGIRSSLVMLFGAILAAVCAVIAVFLMHFSGLVARSLKEAY